MWCLGVPGSGEQAVGGPSCPACPPKPPQAARWDYWGSSSCPSVPLWGLSTALARRAESSWAAAKARAHHPKIGPGMAVLRVTLGPKRERVGQGGSEPPQWFCGVFPLIFCASPPPSAVQPHWSQGRIVVRKAGRVGSWQDSERFPSNPVVVFN